MKTTEFTIETTEFTIETTEATTETTQVITETTEAITETTEATTENTQASTETTQVITETTEAITETTEATTETTFASNEITDLTSETTESTTETANVATDVVERTSKITYIKSTTSLTTASTEISYLCTSTGRFADKTNCSNYYICSSNPSGAYYTYLYTCSSGSLYDQDTDKCSTSPNVTCGPRCNIYGFYCLSNSTLQLCGNVDEAPSGDIYECYAGNYCSMDCFTQCSETIPCISTTTTIFQTTKQTTTSDLSSTTPEPYQCTATGKFADTNNCSEYYVCSSRSSGGFYMYNFTCPSGSLFDRDNGVCTLNASVVCGPRCNDYGFYCLTNTTLQLCADKDVAASGDVYTCYDGNYCSMDCSLMCSETVPCTSSTSTTEFTTTTTISTLTNTQTSFECIASGRFRDPVNCTEYYSCVAKSSGGFYQSQYSCPSGSIFNSSTFTCTYSDSTVCTTNTPLTFQCSENGRFEDTSNSSNYILCISQSSGSFYQITYPCPSGSLFDPGTGKCTYSLARCSSTSTTNTAIVSTFTITVVIVVMSLTLSLDIFSCTSSGRFADSSSYYNFYVCSSNPSGGYYIYSYTCPNGSVYNKTPHKHVPSRTHVDYLTQRIHCRRRYGA